MPNGDELMTELEFTNTIKSMGDRELLEFNTLQLYQICERSEKHSKRISVLEKRDTRIFGISGAVGGVGSGVIVGIINYFKN